MKTVLLASVLMSVAPLAAHAQSSSQSQSAEELTRLLNGAPPAAARPAPAPVSPSSQPRPAPVQAAPSTARPSTATPAMTPITSTRSPAAAASVAPARTSPPPAPAADQGRASARAAPAVPGALSPAAVAALPFRIELPSGFQLFEGRGAPNTHVYSVRKAGKTFAMIYTGPASQFPIYDGEQVTAAGRVSVIVPEGMRRIAMEHLFQQPTAPNEIHVWLMSLSGADRDAAEGIAQSVDPK